jgi:hypothetical protein
MVYTIGAFFLFRYLLLGDSGGFIHFDHDKFKKPYSID